MIKWILLSFHKVSDLLRLGSCYLLETTLILLKAQHFLPLRCGRISCNRLLHAQYLPLRLPVVHLLAFRRGADRVVRLRTSGVHPEGRKDDLWPRVSFVKLISEFDKQLSVNIIQYSLIKSSKKRDTVWKKWDCFSVKSIFSKTFKSQ